MHQTYHLVNSEAVIELQGGNVVGLLKIVNHQELSILQSSCALKELFKTFLEGKQTKKYIRHQFFNQSRSKNLLTNF